MRDPSILALSIQCFTVECIPFIRFSFQILFVASTNHYRFMTSVFMHLNMIWSARYLPFASQWVVIRFFLAFFLSCRLNVRINVLVHMRTNVKKMQERKICVRNDSERTLKYSHRVDFDWNPANVKILLFNQPKMTDTGTLNTRFIL